LTRNNATLSRDLRLVYFTRITLDADVWLLDLR
jgi:hypothetical protein